MRIAAAVVMAVVAAGAGIAAAPRAATGESKAALEPLLSCRAETDPAKRLACFDKAADALGAATERRDIVVIDKGEVQKARRSLFGFSVPSLKIFGGDDDAKTARGDRHGPAGLEPEQDQITATVRTARQDGDGNWIVELDDGAIWHQVGGTMFTRPRAGATVTIKRAALGSYFLRVGNAPGVKARREG